MHTYNFGDPGYAAIFLTPFAVSDWGVSAPSGSGVALVVTKNNDAGYAFSNLVK